MGCSRRRRCPRNRLLHRARIGSAPEADASFPWPTTGNLGRSDDAGRTGAVWLAIPVAREVLQSLIYAALQAVDREGLPLALIHRDISPHNIFMCFDGQVKLTDFGVAKVAQSSVLTQVGVTKGK